MIRRIELDGEMDALFQCWNASAHFDRLPLEVFQEKLEDDGYRDGFGWVEEEEGAVCGFVVGVVRTVDRISVGYVKLLAVHPERRRQGSGSALLVKLLDAFAVEGVNRIRIAESAPNYLTPGLDVRYTPALHLFEKHGFKTIGEAYNMEASLPGEGYPTDQILGLTIRRAQEADGPEVEQFVAIEWKAWVPEVHCSLGRDPVAVHLALNGEEIVAFSAYEGNNASLGTFGPMGTAPEYRGRGIGENLLKWCLTDLVHLGYERVTIPWVAPIGFYTKTVHATISRVFTRMEKQS
ncbi:MAG: GNAT family N-acetyltransferase [Bacteroidetes bacterium]|nr:GNAT family N-acetyltransferase [Bacteroidota bacterium]